MNELGNGPWDKNYKPSGISKAEEAALKAYPPKRKVVSMTGAIYTVVGGDFERRIFQEGYEQAEKETIERAVAWLKENANKYIVDLTPTYPDAPANIIVGGMCWEHLKDYLQNE